ALKTDWRDAETAKLRGRRLHLLLEHLPKTTPAAWAATAPMILAAEGDCNSEERAALFSEAHRILTDPNLRALFEGDALAEVPLTAFSKTLNHQVYGVIDRLILRDDQVLAVDFKSNQIVPQSPADVSEGYLRQMAAYDEMLRALYPTRAVKLAILWTSGPSLMELPNDLLEQALQRAAGTGVGS
ncbi:MAG: PD-(D/E)XK nuclease family protein, partial [Paracoccaceae bacterium]